MPLGFYRRADFERADRHRARRRARRVRATACYGRRALLGLPHHRWSRVLVPGTTPTAWLGKALLLGAPVRRPHVSALFVGLLGLCPGLDLLANAVITRDLSVGSQSRLEERDRERQGNAHDRCRFPLSPRP